MINLPGAVLCDCGYDLRQKRATDESRTAGSRVQNREDFVRVLMSHPLSVMQLPRPPKSSKKASNEVPVCSVISLLTTVVIEVFIIILMISLPGSGFAAIGIFYFGAFAILIGSVINGIAGFVGVRRSETYCGQIAAVGVAFWLATVVVISTLPESWLKQAR